MEMNWHRADVIYLLSDPLCGGNTFARFFYHFEEIDLLERSRILDLTQMALRVFRPTDRATEEENAQAFYEMFQERCRNMELSGMWEFAVVHSVVCLLLSFLRREGDEAFGKDRAFNIRDAMEGIRTSPATTPEMLERIERMTAETLNNQQSDIKLWKVRYEQFCEKVVGKLMKPGWGKYFNERPE